MEKNQLIGFILIFVLVITWSLLNRPTDLEEVPTVSADSLAQMQDQVPVDEAATMTATPAIDTALHPDKDSLSIEALVRLRAKYAQFGKASMGESQQYKLENDKMTVAFDSKGGRISYVELKDHYKLWKDREGGEIKSPVRLFEDDKNRFNFTLPIDQANVNTSDLYFDAQVDGNKIRFTAAGDEGAALIQEYTLNPDSYEIEYQIKTSNVNGLEDKASLAIDNYLDKIEQNVSFERNYSTVYFKPTEEDSDYCSCRSSDIENQSEELIEWVSFTHQFFNTSFITTGDRFSGLVAETQMLDDEANDLKLTKATMGVPLSANGSFGMKIFAGPNKYKLLTQYDNSLQEIIPFGRSIFGSINRHVIRPFFNFLSKYIGSKGVVIILMIFIIKMALYPFTYKMLHSQAKMGALKPQLAKLKDRYKDDMQKQQMETMKIYREYGVSPMGGCMPMVLQMPIWYALFRFFPASITFRQEPFLWAHDLSTYDSFINLPFYIPGFGGHLSLFTILWAVSTVIYTYYNMRHMDMSANPAMKYVQYLMPVMFFVFFNQYASGLTCYMFFSNLFNIGQTIITKKFVFDEEKILAQLNKQKEKPKKQNKFQKKLEEAMKQQQKIAEERAKKQKKKK